MTGSQKSEWMLWRDPYGALDPDYKSRPRPHQFDEVEVWREGWEGGPVMIKPRAMDPRTNVYGLMWRPPESVG